MSADKDQGMFDGVREDFYRKRERPKEPEFSTVEKSPEVLPPPDAQNARHIARVESVVEVNRLIRKALDEAELEVEDSGIGQAAKNIVAIRSDASTIQARSLAIGRALMAVQEQLGHGGYAAVCRAGLFRFSDAAATKFRKIAAAVDDGLLPALLLPNTIEAAYLAAAQPAEKIQQLVDDKVLRPDVTVREMREALRPPVREPEDVTPLEELEERLKALRKQIRSLRDQEERLAKKVRAMRVAGKVAVTAAEG